MLLAVHKAKGPKLMVTMHDHLLMKYRSMVLACSWWLCITFSAMFYGWCLLTLLVRSELLSAFPGVFDKTIVRKKAMVAVVLLHSHAMVFSCHLNASLARIVLVLVSFFLQVDEAVAGRTFGCLSKVRLGETVG